MIGYAAGGDEGWSEGGACGGDAGVYGAEAVNAGHCDG